MIATGQHLEVDLATPGPGLAAAAASRSQRQRQRFAGNDLPNGKCTRECRDTRTVVGITVTDHKRIDALYAQIRDEQRKGAMADAERIARLEADLKAEQEAARDLMVDGEFEKAIEQAGGTGLNATL